MTLTQIAETYLRMIPTTKYNPHEGMYVRLAYKYGVPFGRIVSLSGLPSDVVAAFLDGAS
jgi:hypothetical protein